MCLSVLLQIIIGSETFATYYTLEALFYVLRYGVFVAIQCRSKHELPIADITDVPLLTGVGS